MNQATKMKLNIHTLHWGYSSGLGSCKMFSYGFLGDKLFKIFYDKLFIWTVRSDYVILFLSHFRQNKWQDMALVWPTISPNKTNSVLYKIRCGFSSDGELKLFKYSKGIYFPKHWLKSVEPPTHKPNIYLTTQFAVGSHANSLSSSSGWRGELSCPWPIPDGPGVGLVSCQDELKNFTDTRAGESQAEMDVDWDCCSELWIWNQEIYL